MGAARAQVLRHVVAAVAGAEDERLASLPGGPVGVAARMQHRAGEALEAGQVGRIGMPLTPVAKTRWRGRMTRSVPSARRSATSHLPLASS